MLFHDWIFPVFFLVFYCGYLALRRTGAMNAWLLIGSYVFYAWWNPLYLILIVYSTLIDYFSALAMGRWGKRPWLLIASIGNNLFLLGFFKYAGFVTDNLNAGLAALGASYELPAPDVLLPVGISFYTFQSMSYTIDYYRGRIEIERNLIRFASFVALFPQLVAGPIERASSLLPQLRETPVIRSRDVSDGLSLFVAGLFKKVVMADTLGMYVDKVYGGWEFCSGPTLFVGTFAFAWQIYFDFSGYTDMARGVGRAMGIHLTMNFNNPYLATGLGDFWGRWHISLSSWFRDYVYIPLGGSRGGRFRTNCNIVATMVVSGLWHGAAWTFVIWGALHAAGRLITRGWERGEWYRERCPAIVKRGWVFLFVTLTWIYFRAESLEQANGILWRIVTFASADGAAIEQFMGTVAAPVVLMVAVLAIWAYQFAFESRARRWLELAPVRVAMATAMLLSVFFVAGKADNFIYFIF